MLNKQINRTVYQNFPVPYRVLFGAECLLIAFIFLLGVNVLGFGGYGGITVAEKPFAPIGLSVLNALSVQVCLLSFGINWLASIPAIILRTEKFFDLVGSLTYISCVLFSLTASGQYAPRQIVLSAMAFTWACRLGSFLFRRIHRAGKDGRFDKEEPT